MSLRLEPVVAMPQCQATTLAGKRCRRIAADGEIYCHTHAEEPDLLRVGTTLTGLIMGARVGGPIGALAGGALGYVAPRMFRSGQEVKTPVFVSFDYDNDRSLRDLIIGQVRHPDSPFQVVDHSLKEAAPERDWAEKARRAIARSEVVVVLLGSRTRWASGVLKEVGIANELGKRTFQVIGYQDGDSSWAVPGAGRVYRWSWDNLKKLLG